MKLSPKSIVRWFSTNHFTSNYRLRPTLHMVLSISDQVFLFPAKRLRTFDFELFYYFGLSTSDEIKREKSKVTTSDLFYHFDPTSIFRTIDFGPEFFGSKCIITSNQLFSTSDSLFIDFGLHTSTSDFTTSTPTQVRSRCCPQSQRKNE